MIDISIDVGDGYFSGTGNTAAKVNFNATVTTDEISNIVYTVTVSCGDYEEIPITQSFSDNNCYVDKDGEIFFSNGDDGRYIAPNYSYTCFFPEKFLKAQNSTSTLKCYFNYRFYRVISNNSSVSYELIKPSYKPEGIFILESHLKIQRNKYTPIINSFGIEDINASTISLTCNKYAIIPRYSIAYPNFDFHIKGFADPKNISVYCDEAQCLIPSSLYNKEDEAEEESESSSYSSDESHVPGFKLYDFYQSVELEIEDTRGFTSRNSIIFNGDPGENGEAYEIIDYAKPSIISFVAERDDQNIVLNFKGSWFGTRFGKANEAVSNELTIEYCCMKAIYDETKKKYNYEGGDWVPVENNKVFFGDQYFFSGRKKGNIDNRVIIENIDYNSDWRIQLRISDKIETIMETIIVPSLIPLVDWSKSDFNFNVPVTAKGFSTPGGVTAHTITMTGEANDEPVIDVSGGRISAKNISATDKISANEIEASYKIKSMYLETTNNIANDGSLSCGRNISCGKSHSSGVGYFGFYDEKGDCALDCDGDIVSSGNIRCTEDIQSLKNIKAGKDIQCDGTITTSGIKTSNDAIKIYYDQTNDRNRYVLKIGGTDDSPGLFLHGGGAAINVPEYHSGTANFSGATNFSGDVYLRDVYSKKNSDETTKNIAFREKVDFYKDTSFNASANFNGTVNISSKANFGGLVEFAKGFTVFDDITVGPYPYETGKTYEIPITINGAQKYLYVRKGLIIGYGSTGLGHVIS